MTSWATLREWRSLPSRPRTAVAVTQTSITSPFGLDPLALDLDRPGAEELGEPRRRRAGRRGSGRSRS